MIAVGAELLVEFGPGVELILVEFRKLGFLFRGEIRVLGIEGLSILAFWCHIVPVCVFIR